MQPLASLTVMVCEPGKAGELLALLLRASSLGCCCRSCVCVVGTGEGGRGGGAGGGARAGGGGELRLLSVVVAVAFGSVTSIIAIRAAERRVAGPCPCKALPSRRFTATVELPPLHRSACWTS